VSILTPLPLTTPDAEVDVTFDSVSPREVVADSHAHYFRAELTEHTLVPNDDARLVGTRFSNWLSKPMPTNTGTGSVQVGAHSCAGPLGENNTWREFRRDQLPPETAPGLSS